jgi:hypothetical protein
MPSIDETTRPPIDIRRSRAVAPPHIPARPVSPMCRSGTPNARRRTATVMDCQAPDGECSWIGRHAPFADRQCGSSSRTTRPSLRSTFSSAATRFCSFAWRRSVPFRAPHLGGVCGPAPVAQGIEQRFPKPQVAGSNPAGSAKKFATGLMIDPGSGLCTGIETPWPCLSATRRTARVRCGRRSARARRPACRSPRLWGRTDRRRGRREIRRWR